MNRKKIVIFGIDGGTFDIVRPLIQKSKLPNIASIMRDGFSSKLISVVPSITAPAWTSFMTGVNPGRHGIFDFISDIHDNGKEGTLLNSTNIRIKTLYQILSEQQKKLIVIGVPFSYPPIKINGIMVSISMSCAMATYPQVLYKEIVDKTGYNQEMCKPVDSFGEVPREEVLDEIIKRADYLTDKVKEISCYLLERQEWDFFMAHFMATDTIQHYFWHFIDSAHPAHDAQLSAKYRNTINETYMKIDSAIDEILNKAGNDCNIIIVSDHGFAPIYEFFYVNRWLEEKGLLKIKESKKYVWKAAYPSLYKILFKAGFENLSNKLPDGLRNIKIPAFKKVLRSFSELIDWNKTRAYASPFGININLKGREPYGIVEPGLEFYDVRELIREELCKLRHNGTNRNLISKVLFKEEVYNGPYTSEAADIFFFFKEPFFLQSNEIHNLCFEKLTNKNFATANHRYSPEGIFIIKGINIEKNANPIDPIDPSIMDIAPTILYLTGLPIPETIEGRVLTEIIRQEYLQKYPIGVIKDRDASVIKEEVAVSISEDEQVREHLRRLGYLG